jgi:hypothetical protein
MNYKLALSIFKRLQRYLKQYDIMLFNSDKDKHILNYKELQLASGPWVIRLEDKRYGSCTWTNETIYQCIFTVFRIIYNRSDISAFKPVRHLGDISIKSLEEISIKLDLLGV